MRHLRWYGFLYILAILFLVSWVGQFATQLMVAEQEAKDHHQNLQWADYWPEFLASTFENWQSEFLQLLVQALGMVVLASWVFRRAEADKKRMEAKLDRLLRAQGLEED